ncbi:MAG: hypothetical protein NT126_03660 [Bacteroidetes bacterium]|nr:hypothetical protein [Bacteroidota bacterium]
MKKILSFVALMAVVAITVSSCKTHEKCPAYGLAKTQKTARG